MSCFLCALLALAKCLFWDHSREHPNRLVTALNAPGMAEPNVNAGRQRARLRRSRELGGEADPADSPATDAAAMMDAPEPENLGLTASSRRRDRSARRSDVGEAAEEAAFDPAAEDAAATAARAAPRRAARRGNSAVMKAEDQANAGGEAEAEEVSVRGDDGVGSAGVGSEGVAGNAVGSALRRRAARREQREMQEEPWQETAAVPAPVGGRARRRGAGLGSNGVPFAEAAAAAEEEEAEGEWGGEDSGSGEEGEGGAGMPKRGRLGLRRLQALAGSLGRFHGQRRSAEARGGGGRRRESDGSGEWGSGSEGESAEEGEKREEEEEEGVASGRQGRDGGVGSKSPFRSVLRVPSLRRGGSNRPGSRARENKSGEEEEEGEESGGRAGIGRHRNRSREKKSREEDIGEERRGEGASTSRGRGPHRGRLSFRGRQSEAELDIDPDTPLPNFDLGKVLASCGLSAKEEGKWFWGPDCRGVKWVGLEADADIYPHTPLPVLIWERC